MYRMTYHSTPTRCDVVPRRDPIQGPYPFVPLDARLESNKEEEEASPLQVTGVHLTESVYKVVLQKSILHQSVNVSYTIPLIYPFLMIKDRLTDLCGNCLLQNNSINTFCEIRVRWLAQVKLIKAGPPNDLYLSTSTEGD